MPSSWERVEATFNFEEPDRVPLFEQAISPNIASEILGREAYTAASGPGQVQIYELTYKGKRDILVKRIVRDIVEIHVKLELDIVRPPLVPGAESRGPTRIIDKYTYYFEDESTGLWHIERYNPSSMECMLVDSAVRREGIKAIEQIVKSLEDEKFNIDETTFEAYDLIVKKLGNEKFIAGYGGIGIPIDQPWLIATLSRPDLIERYLDRQLERTLKMIEASKKHGADFILGGGDLATAHGPVYSPETFRRFILPRLRRITDFCHHLGIPYIFRTDGNIWPIAKELLLDSGVDGYGEIDIQSGMKLKDLREAFPNLVLWGNVDCARTLVFGPRERVIKETIRDIHDAAPGGGYILGSSNTIHPNVKTEYFMVMIEAARKYGVYPTSKLQKG